MPVALEHDRPGAGEDDRNASLPECQGHDSIASAWCWPFSAPRWRVWWRPGAACSTTSPRSSERHVDAADDRHQRPARSARRGSSIAETSERRPRKKSMISSDVRPRVPYPPGCPGRPCPESPVTFARKVHIAPVGAIALAVHRGEPGVEARRRRPEGHHDVEHHGHPGRVNVDEMSGRLLALRRIGRGAKKPIQRPRGSAANLPITTGPLTPADGRTGLGGELEERTTTSNIRPTALHSGMSAWGRPAR